MVHSPLTSFFACFGARRVFMGAHPRALGIRRRIIYVPVDADVIPFSGPRARLIAECDLSVGEVLFEVPGFIIDSSHDLTEQGINISNRYGTLIEPQINRVAVAVPI